MRQVEDSLSWRLISLVDDTEHCVENFFSQKLFYVVKTNLFTLEIDFSAKILLPTLLR